jgi:hypothetical protein
MWLYQDPSKTAFDRARHYGGATFVGSSSLPELNSPWRASKVDNNFTLTAVAIQGNRMRLAIDAPGDFRILGLENLQRDLALMASATLPDCARSNGRGTGNSFQVRTSTPMPSPDRKSQSVLLLPCEIFCGQV